MASMSFIADRVLIVTPSSTLFVADDTTVDIVVECGLFAIVGSIDDVGLAATASGTATFAVTVVVVVVGLAVGTTTAALFDAISSCRQICKPTIDTRSHQRNTKQTN